MLHSMKNHKWSTLLLCIVVLLALFVAGCGGALTSSSGSNGASIPAPAAHNAASSSNQQKTPGRAQQYLIKTLNITMEVKDTQRVANDLQSWISSTDPLSTAQNINYEQVGDNLYNVSMAFSVQASLFPRIESYLNNYPIQHNGRLLNTSMSTQDVSSDYVDTQSRLNNLRGEQQRLLTLLSHASALGDVLSIDQRLTDVEGQIEQIEAHLNSLNGQITFYNISISLQPSQAALTPSTGWSVSSIWQNALSSAIAFAQVLATVFIWLVVFSVYIIPLALIVWFVRRWRRAQEQRAAPAVAATTQPPPS
jgi:Domain of unknown function (DUF4349)